MSNKLFEYSKRKRDGRKLRTESVYEYYRDSTREDVAVCRDTLEELFCPYPEVHKPKFLTRFRDSDEHHHAAFWELILYTKLLKLGLTVELEPTVEKTQLVPDFKVSGDGFKPFYLEATVVHSCDPREERRKALFAESLHQIESLDYLLMIWEHGQFPKQNPAAVPVIRQIEHWLLGLNKAEIIEKYSSRDIRVLPCKEIVLDSWRLEFTAIPRTEELGENTGSRSAYTGIGIGMHEDITHKRVRDRLREKAKKYKISSLPLVIAVNVLKHNFDDISLETALFGSESVTYQVPNFVRGNQTRVGDGLLGPPDKTRYARIGGIIVGTCVDFWNHDRCQILYIANPFSDWAAPNTMIKDEEQVSSWAGLRYTKHKIAA